MRYYFLSKGDEVYEFIGENSRTVQTKNLTIETAPKMEQAKTSDKPTIQI